MVINVFPSSLEVDITSDNLEISEIIKSEAPRNSTAIPGKQIDLMICFSQHQLQKQASAKHSG